MKILIHHWCEQSTQNMKNIINCSFARYSDISTITHLAKYRLIIVIEKIPKHTPLTYILLNSNIFLAQCLLYKLLFWRVAMNTFKMTLVLLKRNCKMHVKWLSEQFWRCCLCIYVLIETADNEITASVRHTSVYVVNKTRVSVIHSFTHTETQNMQDSYLNRLCGLIFTDTSPYGDLI